MIAIYIDNRDNENIATMVNYIVDFTFSTLGYSYRIIHSLKGLTEFDVLFWYDSKGIEKEDIASFARKVPIILVRYNEILYIPSQLKGNKLQAKIKKISFYNEIIPIIHNNIFAQLVESIKDNRIALYVINFDILGNIYFHLNDNEFKAKKENNGIIEQASVFDEYYHEPIINHLLAFTEKIIISCCERLDFPLIKKEYWPHGEDYGVIFTHSVDKLEKWGKGAFGDFLLDSLPLLAKGNFVEVWRNLVSGVKFFLNNREQYWNFQNYLDLDEKYGIIATWFVSFIENNGFEYNIGEENKLTEELDNIIAKGHEIGLLVSPYELDNIKIKTAKNKLMKISQEDLIGIRVLGRPLHDKVIRDIHRNNLHYDSSVISHNIDLIKNGNVLPHNKLVEGIRTFPLEIPITFSDEILKSSKYTYKNFETATRKMDSLINKIKSNGGLICLDFSISNFRDIYYLEKLYTYTIESIKETNYYNNSCKNMTLWWKARKKVLITNVEWGANIQFHDDFAFFTIKIFTKRRIKEITSVDYKIEDNVIIMSNIKANNVVNIVLE